MENRSTLSIQIGAFQRYLFWKGLGSLYSNVRIAEFPKSGGTWLCQMIAEMTELPFPRNSMLPFKRCVEHSHLPGPGRDKTIVLVRDGRDVMVSAYFHFLQPAAREPKSHVSKWRKHMGSGTLENVEENLEQFILLFAQHFTVGGKNMTWSSHVMSYQYERDEICLVRYEDLINDGVRELEKIQEWLDCSSPLPLPSIIEKYSFKKQSNRSPGVEDRSSFLRKGIAGDWRNYFTTKTLNTFYNLHGEAMEHLKYD